MITTIQWTGTLMASLGACAVAVTLPVYASLRRFERIRREKLIKLQGNAMKVSFVGLLIVFATGFMG